MLSKLDPHIAAIIVGTLLVLAGYCTGKYTGKPDITTSEIVKTDEKSNENKNTQTHTVVTTTKSPTGEIKTTKVTDTLVSDKIIDKKDSAVDYQQVVTQPKPKVNISLLAAYDILHPALNLPAYGLSVSKEVLGTATLGAFGLNNGIIGLSVGLDF